MLKVVYCTVVIAILLLLVTGAAVYIQQVFAAAGNVSPTGDVITDWAAVGTGNNTCDDELCDRIDDQPGNPDTSTYIRSEEDNDEAQFEMGTFDTERGAMGVTLHLHMRNFFEDGEANDVDVQVLMPGGNTSTEQVVVEESEGWQDREVSWSGNYSQNDIDNMEVRLEQIEDVDCSLIIFCSGQGEDIIDVATLYIEVEYDPFPELNQSGYRLYENQDDSTPGQPLADTNERAELPSQNSVFRLRTLHTVGLNNFEAAEFDYRLQVAERGGSCESAGFVDVETNSGDIRFFDNPNTDDGDPADLFGDDPATGNSIEHQSYQESNPVSALEDAEEGDDILWDFALEVVDVDPGSEYCLRLAYEDGSELSTYSEYPVVLAVGDVSVAMVDESNEIIANPGIVFPSTEVLTECQENNVNLGDEQQRLRVRNDLATDGWNVNLAASGGSEAVWSSGDDSYAYNQPDDNGCDSGQMSIDPYQATINSPECSTNGMQLGPADSFEQGEQDILQLITATDDSERFCDFFFEGIDVTQTIPPEQSTGQYSLDMTLTIVAD